VRVNGDNCCGENSSNRKMPVAHPIGLPGSIELSTTTFDYIHMESLRGSGVASGRATTLLFNPRFTINLA
jgi:hypothetical protein